MFAALADRLRYVAIGHGEIKRSSALVQVDRGISCKKDAWSKQPLCRAFTYMTFNSRGCLRNEASTLCRSCLTTFSLKGLKR